VIFKNQIVNFKPFNEQEERDKEYCLKFIESFDDVLTRENVFGHFTASAFVVNKERTKLLLVYHNIFGGYIFPGGHMDGETDFLSVARREVLEETGVNVELTNDEIFLVWVGPVKGHIKRGKYVSAHTHLDLAYLFEADDKKELKIKPDENSQVGWFTLDGAIEASKEEWFKEHIYSKLNEKLSQLR
jgi:8-oxo-dGTP pyrophosphatase MutT (NUDIX family)